MGTELAKLGGTEKLQAIREGANLAPERWSKERVLAAVRLLPTKFQDPTNAIGFLAMANAYDLDPFAKEIWAWENKKTGKLQTMVSRDGWTKILRRDESVAGVQMDHVRAEDAFSMERTEEGKVLVHHESNPFGDNPVVGAYCVVRVADGPDIFQARKLDDYGHLRSKKNWSESPQEMILTRVVSFAGRLATGVSVHTEADFQLKEDAVTRHLQAKQDERESELVESLEDEPKEIEAKVVEEDEEDEDEPEPEAEDFEEAAEEGKAVHVCKVCGKEFDSPQALGGHSRSHSLAERRPDMPEVPESDEVDEEVDEAPDEDDGRHTAANRVEGLEGLPPGYSVHYIEDDDLFELVIQGDVVGDHDDPEDAVTFARERAGYDPQTGTGEQLNMPVEEEEPEPEPEVDPYAGETKGSILAMCYQVASEMEDGADAVYEIAGELLGTDEATKVKIAYLDRDQRIELHKRLEKRLAS